MMRSILKYLNAKIEHRHSNPDNSFRPQLHNYHWHTTKPIKACSTLEDQLILNQKF